MANEFKVKNGIILGNTPALNSISTATPVFQTHAININGSQQGIYSWSSTATTAATQTFLKSKSNTIGTRGIVGINDTVGSIRFAGDDGTAFIESASIISEIDATPGTNDMPGRLIFSTTADGTSAPTERMRIDNAGNVGIGIAPTAVLNIRNKTGNTNLLLSALSGTAATLELNSDAFASVNATGGSQLGVFVGATERIRISTAGVISLGASPGTESLRVTSVTSAVNYVNITGSPTNVVVTTNSPTISAQGSDANIDLSLQAKGTGSVVISSASITGGTVVAESLSITTNTTPAVFMKDNNLTSWDYSGKSISISAQELTATGIFFKPDGTEMYIIGQTGDDVTQYTLSTAWDVTTAIFTRVSGTLGESNPSGVFFKPDGTVMYVIGTTTDTVREFSVSTAWDVSTITFVRSFSVTTQDTTPNDLWFKPDGTKMYIVGTTNDRVYEYNLSTAWDISTAVFLQFFSVGTQDTNPVAVNFNSDGTRMYVLGITGLDINRYSLSTPWDISTAVFFNNFYIGFLETNPNGLFINLDAGVAYVVGTSLDTVFQYNTLTDGVALISNTGLFIDGSLYTNKNLIVTSNARIDGALSVSGTISGSLSATGVSSSGTINLFGSTSSAISLGTSVTTGTITVGGLLQTGAITVGQSTSAQTLNLGTGATLTATTKAINIGTGGVSGSTTNITVGSANGSTTTMLGSTVIGGVAGSQSLQVNSVASAANYWNMNGAAANGTITMGAAGIDGNIPFAITSKGTSAGLLYTNGFNALQAVIFHTDSAVNYVGLTGAGTNATPTISSAGSDTNVGLNLTSKGFGVVNVNTGTGTVAKFQDRGVTTVNSPFIFRAGLSGTTAGVLTFPVSPMLQSPDPSDFTFNTNAGTVGGQSGSTQVVLGHTASAVNYLRLTGSGTNGGVLANAAPSISVLGSDTNINLVLTPKGTGNVATSSPILTGSTVTAIGGFYIGSGASPHYMYSGSASQLSFRVGTSPSYFSFEDNAGSIGLSTGNPFYFKGWAGTYTFGIAGPVNAQAVNYLTVGTSVTGAGPTLYPNGSDTNISLSLQPKGSGAINFVTGSKVNLGLGNSVSGIKIGQSGVGYTSFPTVVIAAPNGPSGGTQAVAGAINSMKNVTATVVSGGTGYAVGNLLTIVGGVIQVSAGTMTVTSVSAGGVITGAYPINFAPYGAPLQANPVSVTGGTGSGATFNIGYGIYSGTVGITNAGSGYVEQPAISFTGGGTPTTVATGFATVGSIPVVNTLGSALSFTTPSGEQFRINDSNAPAVNYLQVTGGATNISPGFSVQGTDAAIGFGFTTKGTGNTQFSSNQYGNVKLLLQAVNASVNYLNIRPSLTNFPITLNANGSDTNTGIAVISKGTGAIDLAAGSSGINISNGSTVTSIKLTSIGSGMTSVPTVTVSAPTTPGGVTALANIFDMGIWGVGVTYGGTGYSVNDVLTFVGGTVATSAVTVKVTAVSGSTITTVTVLNYGSYSALPATTAAATTVVPAGGTGATLNSTWCVYGTTISNAGSGYVEQPTVTFSTAGGVAAIGYAVIGSGTTVKSLGTSMTTQTANGQTFLQVLDDTTTPSSTSGLYLVGASSGLGRVGLRSNKALYIGTQGGQPFGFFTNTTSTSDGSQQFAITNTNGSVNWISVTGGGTTVWPTLSAAGSDANIGLFLNAKGSAGFTFATSGATQTYIAHTASAVNYPQLTGGITGNAPTISAQGTNTNIGLNLSAKGSGSINAITNGGVVNLSNGSGLTSVVRTNGGVGYTGVVTATVSAPTTPGGVTATVTAYTAATVFPIASGGTGYSVNDVLSVVGGTGIQAQTFTVTSVNLGVITGVSILSYGLYTVLPPSTPATTTVVPVGGTGATFNLSSWAMSACNIVTAGSGYVETPTITFTGAGSTGAAAYALIGSGTTLKSIGNALSLATAGGVQVVVSDVGGNTTDYVYLGGSPFGRPGIGAKTFTGSGNASLMMFAQGTGGTIQFSTNNSAQKQVEILHTASAVNHMTITGGAENVGPTLSVGGSDTNISLNLSTKGTGSVALSPGGSRVFSASYVAGQPNNFTNYYPTTNSLNYTAAGADTNIGFSFVSKGSGAITFATNTTASAKQVQISDIPTAVNFLNFTGNSSGNSPTITGTGSDLNVGLDFYMKGWNSIKFNSTTGGQLFQIGQTTATTANFFQVLGNSTGNAPTFSAQGSDANVGLVITGKGTGSVVLNGTASSRTVQIDPVASDTTTYMQFTKFVAVNEQQMIAANTANLGLVATGGGGIFFRTAATSQLQVVVSNTTSAVNYLNLTGSQTGGGYAPTLSALGSDTDINLLIKAKGTGSVFIGSASGAGAGGASLCASPITSSVNYVQVLGAVASGTLQILAAGQSSDIPINLSAKTNSPVYLSNGNGTAARFFGGANSFTIAGAVSGTAPEISVQGTETNIDLKLTPKGTGRVSIGAYYSLPNSSGAIGQVLQITSANTATWETVSSGSGTATLYVGTTLTQATSANQAMTGILSVGLSGSTSGTTTLIPSAIAETTTITLPAISGTVITTGDTGTVTNTMLAGSIADTKLLTISTVGKVSNSATSATNLNTASAIVARDASGNFVAATITAALTGNASTATTLQTARTINSVSFNGSADITVTAAAGTLSGTTLNSAVVTSSLTSVATITSGVWSATDIAVIHGGTGTSTGSITGTGELTFAAGGTNTNINLFPNGTGTVDVASKRISNVAEPSNANDAATKNYVDMVASGINAHQSVVAATTAPLVGAVYNNGSSGVGATLTLTPFITAIDGVTLSTTPPSRVLVKNEATAANNGIYVYTSSTVLTRASDFDTIVEIGGGDFVFVTGGSQANTGWVNSIKSATIGTTSVTFTQFSGAGTYTAGVGGGLVLSGTAFSIDNTITAATSQGSASSVPVLSFNAKGLLTVVTPTAIAIAASQITSGTLSIAQGGTNSSATPTANGVGYGTGTQHAYTGAGTTGQFLLATTGAAPSWSTLSTYAVTSFSGGSTGLLPSTATQGAVLLSGTLATGYGGTGLTSYTVGDILWASDTSTLSKLGKPATPSLLTIATNGTPAWAALTATGITGVGTLTAGTWNATAITVGYGGTGATTLAAKGVVIGNGTGTVTTSVSANGSNAATTSYGILTTDASNNPVWTDILDGGTY